MQDFKIEVAKSLKEKIEDLTLEEISWINRSTAK